MSKNEVGKKVLRKKEYFSLSSFKLIYIIFIVDINYYIN
jgi:hypothetical protein